MFRWIKNAMPRSLYGRAALILVVPVVAIQLVVSITFIQRHYDGVTRQLTSGVVMELAYMLDRIAASPDLAIARTETAEIAKALGFEAALLPGTMPPADVRPHFDLAGKTLVTTLQRGLPALTSVQLLSAPRRVEIWLGSAKGPLHLTMARTRLTASNPHQLLVLMIVTSVLMTLVAFVFLRNQLRPIQKLGVAAAAYGRGQMLPYRPRGAAEVRAAGTAFLDMRARIDRQIEQRTLMLSGVSHDLRTPLTRLRLGLSMLPEDDETAALLRDVGDMQRLVDEFLAFARGDATETPEELDPMALIRQITDDAARAGQVVKLTTTQGRGLTRLRPMALRRALENLIGNAIRYGSKAEVSAYLTDRALRIVVEDDGPGIPKARRDEAMTPFARLDSARDPNKGGGVGLGLAITMDIARSHGGTLRLGESTTLGGLKAELILSR